MTVQLTLREVLEGAVQKEIDSQLLYRDLGRSVKDAAAQDAFRQLADEESRHQRIIEKYLRGEIKEGALSPGEPVDYHIAEHLDQPEVKPGMALKDVFLLAANREMFSHNLYLALAGIHPEGETKRLLTELSFQEMGHKRRVEFLYTETAFPQLDGG